MYGTYLHHIMLASNLKHKTICVNTTQQTITFSLTPLEAFVSINYTPNGTWCTNSEPKRDLFCTQQVQVFSIYFAASTIERYFHGLIIQVMIIL